MNLETKITIYKFTPQLFTLTPFKLPIVCDSYLNVVSAIYSFPIFKYFIFECCHNRVCMLKLC